MESTWRKKTPKNPATYSDSKQLNAKSTGHVCFQFERTTGLWGITGAAFPCLFLLPRRAKWMGSAKHKKGVYSF